ncbi:LLM class flavin-dependent oxidoreductase [Nesterenkonia alkaliphila]|uniref:NtaA/DmoA family FMN-dependent monooxygenase n=1 Tax=Nesterenkonia alkaliphila TaxID=1463631 RepID=A0A7K1UIX0_9MICC|nr:LLM class flavin-dependent oxidoreductase [Nesterenkonia alkaliphila]MVT26312.1 NtaA/DmoA family FMN-dependent monooxygenase [Nesterenkonia alkaliphila]GFZ88281.1 N5,N10-methylene tetrahydromethanopterin reductase [Nesterenkonia alkaliphila]
MTMHFNAFDMVVPVHQSPGLWRHPESQIDRFDQLSYWTGLSQTLERAGFTSLFLADVPGIYDVYGGSHHAAARGGVQYPLLDLQVMVPALAAATTHLGFGITASVTYEQPYLLARRFATLDHLTGGRIAWNIVTSYQDSAARNLGLEGQIPHDERYDRADEFMEVMYKLFERSIAEGAVVADRQAGVFVDPEKVRGIGHRGRWFTVPGEMLTHPGPQRTPLLFQAGSSARGQKFAVDHGEAIFVINADPKKLAKQVEGTRAALLQAARDPQSVKFSAMATIVVGETEAEARARFQEYKKYVDTEAALALFGGWTGVDLSGLNEEDYVADVATEANQSALGFFTKDPKKKWTVREVAEFVSIGGRGPTIVGDPAQVVDQLVEYQQISGVDGFNVSAAVRPADFERFEHYVTPELRRRGLLPERPQTPVTLREALLGAGPHLAEDHPARRLD